MSFESPTYYRLSDRVRQGLVSEVVDQNGGFRQTLDPAADGIDTFFPEYQYNSPGSIRGSLAYVYKDKAIFSLDYTVRNYQSAKFIPKDNVFFVRLTNKLSKIFKPTKFFKWVVSIA